MVQSANPWKCDDLPEFALVHRSRLGRILLKRKMRPGAIVVPPVVRKDLAEMPLVENDYVAQILSTQRSNESLRIGVLPPGARGNRHLMEAESFHSSPEVTVSRR
jgi:hypothetical protein